MRKGFVTFFLNINASNKEMGLDVDTYIELVRRQNEASIKILAEDGYESIFLPVFDEACRVEKTDIIQNVSKDDEEEDE